MWYKLARLILKFRLPLFIFVSVLTVVMGLLATKIKMSYDFARAIPVDNPKYVEYTRFKQQFGEDGNMMVIGVESDKIFDAANFNAYADLHRRLKKVGGVQEILSIPFAVNLLVNDSLGKLEVKPVFSLPVKSDSVFVSQIQTFRSLIFYRELLYNPATNSYLMGVNLNRDSVNSKARTALIRNITREIALFEQQTGIKAHLSGLPYIRTTVANKIAAEMNWFLIGSFLLSAVTLLLFFRSLSAMLLSLTVVGIGVVCSMGTMVLLGYNITLLTAIVPPLIVVIGIPNCIYFLNKYHLAFKETGNKTEALIQMIGRMGVVTLFCNIAAAIGLGVFAFTQSALLKEFGVIAGINIMGLFLISLLLIPSVLSYLPPPKAAHLKYTDNKMVTRALSVIERWTFSHSKSIYAVTALVVIISIVGLFRIKQEGFIVDDLPKNDEVYTDLKWFESNFNGIMPLEVVIDTRKKGGITKSLDAIEKMDSLSMFIGGFSQTARPLALSEGLKFINQAINGGDSSFYSVPSVYDMPLIAAYLKKEEPRRNDAGSMSKLLNGFMSADKQKARMSINIKDIGSVELPKLIDTFKQQSAVIFDSAKYTVSYTGTSVTFLEGAAFIINGLKESIFWAFLLIALSMLYLFRSGRILLCSLIPNLIPLLITAGVMGWAGIRLKPSTVLVFSVALGIVIDVTIRFLVNYKQELPTYNYHVAATLRQTIHHTGLSIIYTSLVLIAGFIIFCFSNFGGTMALGWLTSLTLVTGTFANLLLLPLLIKDVEKKNITNTK